MTLSLAQSTAPVRPRHDATWLDYVTIRDDPEMDWRKLSFHR